MSACCRPGDPRSIAARKQNKPWECTKVWLMGRVARRDYWVADLQAAQRADRLHTEADPSLRATLLLAISAHLSDQAQLYRAAFGRAWLDDDEMDMVEALTNASLVFQLLGDVEQANANPRHSQVAPTTDLEWAACDILDRMTARCDLVSQMALLPELYTRLRPIVGSWAAGAVLVLGYPARPQAAFDVDPVARAADIS